jgi:hypothetical protein
MSRAFEANPGLWQIAGDLFTKNQDWPGAEEFSERLKMALPPEIQQAEQAKKAEGMSPELQQMKQQFDMLAQQKDQMIEAASNKIEELMAEMETLKQEHDIKTAEVSIKERELEIKAFDAETKRIQSEPQESAPPEDTSAMELVKLEYEDKWKAMEAETKILIAQIQAASKAESGVESEQEVESDDSMNQNALAVAIQGFQEALMQMRQPRVATLPDGRQIRVE